MQKIKILLVLLACGSMVVLLDSCNGGTGTSAVIPEPTIEPSPQPAPSPSPSPTNLLENYVNLLTYQPLKYPQLQDENLTQLQLSMTLTHVLAINSILVNYYSDSSCTNLMSEKILVVVPVCNLEAILRIVHLIYRYVLLTAIME